jgi:hypothetical protein
VLTLRWPTLDEVLTPAPATVLESGTLHVTPLGRANGGVALEPPVHDEEPGTSIDPPCGE